MNDLILFLSIILGTYLGCVAFTVVLVRLFFPLKTKEQMEEIEAAKALAIQRASSKQRRVAIPVLSRPRQLA